VLNPYPLLIAASPRTILWLIRTARILPQVPEYPQHEFAEFL